MGDGAWLGLEDSTWYWTGTTLVVVQQLAVWIVFRSQLGWALLTKWFNYADIKIWGVVFIPLLIARPLLLFGLAMSDRQSAGIPRSITIGLGIILLIPAIYTLWSVGHFFGLERALGGDHFREEYREMSFVREGAFRWSNNAMYVFAFLGLWSIALLTGSLAALGLAFFQHTYIWVHYYCTEEPDMRLIYDRIE
jgi:protein-S-isoprenylcysteine O-methyltransferase Ste14